MACRPRPPSPAGPAPSWPGCRVAPATGAPSTPAACRTCSPAGARSPTPAARAELTGAWDIPAGTIPSRAGRDTDGILAAAAAGKIGALVVAGVDPADLADPRLAEAALDAVPFLVSLELRRSAVARRADVVFPVAPVVEKAGSFLDWEGRLRTFEAVLNTTAMNDARVLDALAAQLGVQLGTGDVNSIRRELGALPATRRRPAVAAPSHRRPARPGSIGRGGARHLAPPDRPGQPHRRRRAPGRHRPPAGGPARQGHRGSRWA